MQETHVNLIQLLVKSINKKNLEVVNIFTFVPLSSVQNKCGSFCTNRTTFPDLWVGGVLVKTCIISLLRSTFLKEKQIHHVIKFSFYLGWLIL